MNLLKIAGRVAQTTTAVPESGGAGMGPFLQIVCHECREQNTVKEVPCQSCGEGVWFDQEGAVLPTDVVCPKCASQQTVDTVICPSCGTLTEGGGEPLEDEEDPGPPSDPGSPYDTLEEKAGLK